MAVAQETCPMGSGHRGHQGRVAMAEGPWPKGMVNRLWPGQEAMAVAAVSMGPWPGGHGRGAMAKKGMEKKPCHGRDAMAKWHGQRAIDKGEWPQGHGQEAMAVLTWPRGQGHLATAKEPQP